MTNEIRSTKSHFMPLVKGERLCSNDSAVNPKLNVCSLLP